MSGYLRSLGATIVVGWGLGLSGVVMAQGASENVPLPGLPAAPQTGTMPSIDATWTVGSGGPWEPIAEAGVSYAHYSGANRSQTYTFSKPVDLRFTVTGLNGANEGIRLPADSRCNVPAGAAIEWAGGVLRSTTTVNARAQGAVQVTCALHGVSALTLNGTDLGPADFRRGLFQLTLAIPAIVSAPPSAGGTVGTPWGPYSVVADDSDPADSVPLTYSASGLPPGLSIDPVTGEISGTPTVPGTYAVTILVANGNVISLPQTATITVAAVPAPVPALETWALGLMGALLAGLAACRRRGVVG